MEPTTVISLRRIRSLAQGAQSALKAGGASSGASALEKIRVEAEDGIRFAQDATATHINGDAAELRAAFATAQELADGEAVDACNVLLDAVGRYLSLTPNDRSTMPPPIPRELRGQLIAEADNVAEELAAEYGRARVGAPEHLDGTWSVEVRGLLDDVEMRGYRVWPSGAREELA